MRERGRLERETEADESEESERELDMSDGNMQNKETYSLRVV